MCAGQCNVPERNLRLLTAAPARIQLRSGRWGLMGSEREKVAQKHSRSEEIPLKKRLAVTQGLRVLGGARRLLSHPLQVDAAVTDDKTEQAARRASP